MKTSRQRMALAGFLVAALSHGACASTPDVRHVLVSVEDANGAPVAGVPVFVAVESSTPLVTDAAGSAAADIEVPVGTTFVRTAVSWTQAHEAAYPERYARGFPDWQQEYISNKINYGSLQIVPIPASGDITISFIVSPAIAVSGRLVDVTGNPMRGSVHASGGSVPPGGRALDAGEFTIHGVLAGTDAELFIMVNDGRIIRHAVTPAFADRDLGDIVIPDPPSGPIGRVVGQVLPTSGPLASVVSANGIMWVSEDGTRIYTSPVSNMEGMVYKSLTEHVARAMPVGRYYAIPGMFIGLPWQIEILNAIADGDNSVTASLDEMLVVENELVEITIEAGDLMTAIAESNS